MKLALSYDDVLLVPKYSDIDSRSEVDLTTQLSNNVKLQIPLVPTKMDTVTGVEMAIAMGKMGSFAILPRFDTPEVQSDKVLQVKKSGVKLISAAVGVKEGFLERAEKLVAAGANILNVDVAHGHMKQTIETTKTLKQKFGNDIMIISGIVATKESAVDLYDAGADCLLVGIGAGATCTTRVMTGFGIPGLQSLMDVSEIARKYKKTFMPDAGIRNSGDIVKALAAGASAICAGSMFAGTDEAPGNIIEKDGKKFKQYNGSASLTEKLKHVKTYSKDKNKNYTVQIEGVESLVPYKGSVNDLIASLLAGVRSGLSYAGARTIPEFWQKAEFIQITAGGLRENGAHDVIVYK
ncbi:guanosine monophosphate reductase [Candidatus Microgenomates bacterium]|nr:guanosine monophosphate reductase [Candidatus Microgenomates bacterium]